ncbi:mCG148148 [Mus musculus]|jgi:hypothetical protein|nr:mCG148148 [Mus musculus]
MDQRVKGLAAWACRCKFSTQSPWWKEKNSSWELSSDLLCVPLIKINKIVIKDKVCKLSILTYW